jgi:hypothetical protein
MRGYRREGFHAFSEYDGFSMFENQKAALDQSIKRQADDYILNVNREEYLQHLIGEFSIEPIEIHRDGLSVSTHEEMVPAEMHPRDYSMDRGGSYPRDVLVFHLPFTGDSNLLKVRASSYSMSAPFINVEQGCITFRMINFNLNAEKIKQESENTIRSIETQNGYLTTDIENFNSSLRQNAESIFDARKEQLLKKNNLIAALGVPIKESGNKSGTFSVPAKRTKAIASKPQPKVTDKGYQPEPTLDATIYAQILKIIHDVGKQFERLPSTYSGKEEEHLRDHLLLILEPNFEGVATGETFNKSGKTDILLRHEGKNVFIAELKYWHGKKGFLETISQLLGYLTWRDSKAAVVMFVRNKDFMAVLETAKDSISEHENYLGFVNEQEEGWCSYRFHLNGDKNREVKLAVMLFHIPS